MKNYILRRLFYSLFIVFGVLLITFALFRFAAGDPSAMLLGKNPSPKEIEEMRDKLLSGKPVIFGKWKRTEAYTSLDFSEHRDFFPGVELPEDGNRQKAYFLLPNQKEIKIRKNFSPSNGEKILLELTFDGELGVEGFNTESEQLDFQQKFCSSGKKRKKSAVLEKLPEHLLIKANKDTKIYSVRFFKENPNPFDSQLFCSLGELLRFSHKYPYVVFFDFGKTLTTREEISKVLLRSVWISLLLMIPIFLLENFLSILLGMLSAIFRGKILDKLITVISVCGMSISYIVLIILGQWVLAYYFGLFPIWGFEGIRYLALPILLGVINGMGGSVRFYRAVFLNEMRKDYLRTALAKGCSPFTIYFKHLLRNAAVPICARISTILPFLFTGSLLLESFFGIPGLGYEAINALNNSDLQTLKALVLLTSIIFVIFNLIADVVNSYLDPRIRLE